MKERVEAILSKLKDVSSRRITVFGDFCLDKYLYIDPNKDELSVETGLVAYQVVRSKLLPGAAGTVTGNLRALGAQVLCVGLVGKDGEGFDLLQALSHIGADTELMVQTTERPTNTYMKPMRRQEDGSWVELNRMDMRSFTPLPADLEDQLIENLGRAVMDTMGVVIVDQYVERNFAAVTDRVRDALSTLAKSHPDKFFYVDSRRFVGEFRDIIVKCNEIELLNAMEPGADTEDMETILRNGKALKDQGGKAAIVTLGANGACVFEDESVTKLPAFRVEGPLDIVGAGDATSAGTILGLTLGLPLPTAALLGSCVSSITIQQVGMTGTASVEQVERRIKALL